jgi:hypothetical protein
VRYAWRSGSTRTCAAHPPAGIGLTPAYWNRGTGSGGAVGVGAGGLPACRCAAAAGSPEIIAAGAPAAPGAEPEIVGVVMLPRRVRKHRGKDVRVL